MGKPGRVLVLGIAFVLAIAGTFVFAYRAGRQVRHIHAASDPIGPWMSVPFVAHMRHVPAPVLFQAIGLPPDPHDRRPIRRLARDLHRSVSDLTEQLQQAADAAQHTSGKPPQ